MTGLFRVRVARIEDITPTFRRFTFTGDDLDRYGDPGFDERLKVVFPSAAAPLSNVSMGEDWYEKWRQLPADARPPLREVVLANGLRLLLGPDRRLPMVSVQAAFRGGAAVDPAGKAGLSAWMAAGWWKGTARSSAAELAAVRASFAFTLTHLLHARLAYPPHELHPDPKPAAPAPH